MHFRTGKWRRFVYTLWSPFYDLLARPFGSLRRRSIANLSLRAGERVLIVGAGTGLDLDFLPRDVAITAIDLTPAMLARLIRRAKKLGLQVDARVMDAEAMTFADGAFDAVILHLILAVIADPVACVREVDRVLCCPGRAVILDKFLPDGTPDSRILGILSHIFGFFGTEITRRLSPILDGSGLRITSNEAAALWGLFRLVRVEKSSPDGDAREASHREVG